jgi:hypothetical protein
MVILHYLRYYVPGEREYGTIDDALYGAYWLIEDQTAAPVKITAEGGAVLLEGAALDKAIRRKGDEIEAAYR